MPESIVIGTRGSKLALAQAEKVKGILEKKGFETELKIIKTSGDIKRDRPLHEFRGIGAFVREIDLALKRGEIDIAVHSLKDVPTERVEGTVIAAVLERESPCDAFITKDGKRFEELESSSVIGTSSLRRRAMVLKLRKDLKIENLRGNVDTRLRKLNEGMYDGIFLAEAGLIRLGWDKKLKYQRLDPKIFVPSANQGIIAIATRENEKELVSFMNHEKTYREAMLERAVISELGIGCAIPAGIYAESEGRKIRLVCEILKENGEITARIDEKLDRDYSQSDVKEILREVIS
ncbi:hydroxymethylbilane synthase [Geoglobus acetivorans]|uniref:Probable porphobilinogen deaminase n=1 Tax=Geoglobus acetivorans TaxID=565033 RepID=A0ABZ3GZW6_GEOAI|nr:hydroxymethylbilane synthase [Geoglobus acetivorans]